MKPALILTSLLIVLTSLSCKHSTEPEKIFEPEPQPGRRDYVWTEYNLEIPEGEYAGISTIWGANPNDIWGVGGSSLSQLGIWHFDGTKWRHFIDNPTYTFNQTTLLGFAYNDIFLGNFEGFIWHFNGKTWDFVTRLQVNRYEDFHITQLLGLSKNEIYAVGKAYASYFNEPDLGAIFKYDGKEWKQLELPKLYLDFYQIRKTKSGHFLIPAYKGFIDSTKLISWNGKEFKEIYSIKGLDPVNVFDVSGKIYFNLAQKIYRYEDDGNYTLWKDFTGTDYFGKILCSRSEKDFFVGSFSRQGINHYNGENLKLLYSSSNTYITSGCIFEKDVILSAIDLNTHKPKIIHGRLKE